MVILSKHNSIRGRRQGLKSGTVYLFSVTLLNSFLRLCMVKKEEGVSEKRHSIFFNQNQGTKNLKTVKSWAVYFKQEKKCLLWKLLTLKMGMFFYESVICNICNFEHNLVTRAFSWVKKCSCLFVEIAMTHSKEIDFLMHKLSTLWHKIKSQRKLRFPWAEAFSANKRFLFHQCQPYRSNSLYSPLVNFLKATLKIWPMMSLLHWRCVINSRKVSSL